MLARDIGTFFADPLGFVMYAYPWRTDPALQVVKLGPVSQTLVLDTPS